MSVQPQAAAAAAAPQPEQVQRIVIREQREPRAPRERAFTLDLQPLVFPALAIGTLFFIVEYKDQIANTITRLFNVIPHAGDIAGSIDVPDVFEGGMGGGGGGVSSGRQWYKANGATTNLSTGRQDGSSNRWNKNVIGWQNGFEVMGYLTVTGMSGGSHIGLKMGGPNHSGGRECCWWDGGLRRNGTSYLEIEYPHPTNKNRKYLKSIGRNIDAGVLGIRWLNMKDGNARRIMLWVDKSKKVNAYKWELVYDIRDTGQFMPTSYYDEVPNNQELEIRISDVSASKIKWHTGPVARKINSSSSNLAVQEQDSFDRITVPY